MNANVAKIIHCNYTLHSSTGEKLPFRYTAKMFDDATGLQWNINRWYDPNVGRWISEDPIGFMGNDGNLFRYVQNFLTFFRDPFGLARYRPRLKSSDTRHKNDSGDRRKVASFPVSRNWYANSEANAGHESVTAKVTSAYFWIAVLSNGTESANATITMAVSCDSQGKITTQARENHGSGAYISSHVKGTMQYHDNTTRVTIFIGFGAAYGSSGIVVNVTVPFIGLSIPVGQAQEKWSDGISFDWACECGP
ncbi:MAG: RHS repeat-associated core domain-containing protein [Planctomycetaceae bacterium]|nr:RHS repeat-associated core domain-containing protein [Planctomycetaceae bacterium]